MIACPTCGKPTDVLETRSRSTFVYRRRICHDTACDSRVSTIELVSDVSDDPVVVSRRVLEHMLAAAHDALGIKAVSPIK